MDSGETEIQLPITEQGLDELVESVTAQFQVPNCDATYEAIAASIMHLPPNQAVAKRAYFGAAAIRRLAQEAAYNKLQALDQKRKEKDKERLSLVKNDAASDSGEPVQNA